MVSISSLSCRTATDSCGSARLGCDRIQLCLQKQVARRTGSTLCSVPTKCRSSNNTLTKLEEPPRDCRTHASQGHAARFHTLTTCWATKQGVNQSVFFHTDALRLTEKATKGIWKNLRVFTSSRQLSIIKNTSMDIRKATEQSSNENLSCTMYGLP